MERATEGPGDGERSEEGEKEKPRDLEESCGPLNLLV